MTAEEGRAKMTDRNRRLEGQYGFARGSKAEQARLPEAVPASPVTVPDNHNWVVRPKKPRPSSAGSPSVKPKARAVRRPTLVSVKSPPIPPHTRGFRPMGWFALGCAGMVITGFMAMWSTALIFEEDAFPMLTSVGGSETLPLPLLDDAIVIRDAHLDDPFVPKFRPEASTDSDQDVASSSFQEQI